MRLPEFEHLQPESLEEALDLLSEYREEAKVIAGGMELLVTMKHRLLSPHYLINLKEIPELDFVTYEEERGLRIGALTRLATLVRSPLVREHFPVLAQAARSVAAPPIQTMATLGGNLCQDTRCFYYNQSEFWREARPGCFKSGGRVCHVASGGDHCHSAYQGDLAPVLIALDAQVKLASKEGRRTIPLLDLYTGKGEHPIGLAPGEVLIEIEVPLLVGLWGGDYQKLRYRGAMDFPLVGVAAVLSRNGGACAQARIVVTAVGPAPVVLEEAGRLLERKVVDERSIAQAAEAAYEATHPVARIGSTPRYRRKMVRVLARRAILGTVGSREYEKANGSTDGQR
ncbi:MAG TPA: 4-hydroxybenzoyl-CoA reductase subunit beta [Anaerolineae bacterium]|nr:4-hydroxybenzoyl-CoA reductase subunit beta [Anaerolineae bacterium]